MKRGILIAIEGIDGAGKTTQVELLAAFFKELKEPVVTSKEPTNGVWGQKIRESAAHGRMNLAEELRAFVEDRKEHVRDVIGPALNAGKTVILDRYFYSTIAYQGSLGGNIGAISTMMREVAPEPDAVIIIDIPAEIGVSRIGTRDGQGNHFEGLDNLRVVREVFLQIGKAENISIINGTSSIQTVRREILKALLNGVLHRQHCAKPLGCEDQTTCSYKKNGTCRWAIMSDKAAVLA